MDSFKVSRFLVSRFLETQKPPETAGNPKLNLQKIADGHVISPYELTRSPLSLAQKINFRKEKRACVTNSLSNVNEARQTHKRIENNSVCGVFMLVTNNNSTRAVQPCRKCMSPML